MAVASLFNNHCTVRKEQNARILKPTEYLSGFWGKLKATQHLHGWFHQTGGFLFVTLGICIMKKCSEPHEGKACEATEKTNSRRLYTSEKGMFRGGLLADLPALN